MVGNVRAWLGWPVWIAGAIALVVAALVNLNLADALEYEQDKARFVRNEVAKLDREIAELADLRPHLEIFLARSYAVQSLQKDRDRPARMLAEIVRKRPAGVKLTALSLQESRVRVAGTATSEDAARAFASAFGARPQTAAGRPVAFSFEFQAP